MIDKNTYFFWYISEFFSELITALSKVLLKNTRVKFSFFWREKTTDTVFQVRNTFFELENSYSKGEMVIISNEVRLIVGYIVSTKHRELYRKSHIIHVALFSYFAQVFTSFLYFSLCEKGDSEILHNQHVIWRYGESPLEKNNSFFDITSHRICPSEISQNFRIIWASSI